MWGNEGSKKRLLSQIDQEALESSTCYMIMKKSFLSCINII